MTTFNITGTVTLTPVDPPPPPAPEAQFGLILATNSGLWTGTQADLYHLAWQPTNYVATGHNPKFYDGGKGIAKTWTNVLASGYGTMPGEDSVALCWKGPYIQADFVSTCRSALAKFPTAKLRIIFSQEVDTATGLDPSTWRSTVQAMWFDIQANSDLAGNVEIWLSVTGYNQYEHPRAGRLVEDYLDASVAGRVAGIHYDVYQFQGPYWTQTWTPVPELQDMLDRANALGVGLHIGEYGVTDLRPAGKPDSDAQRARRVQDAIDWCRANVVGLNYYENYAGVDNTTTTGPVGLLKDHVSVAPLYPLTWAAVKGMLP